MAITFNCTHCGKSLTTSDDKAGRKAKCPGCGEVVSVPEPLEDLPDSADEDESPVFAATPGTDEISPRRVKTQTCPMCGMENSPTERKCNACGEPLAERLSKPGRNGKPLEVGRMLSLTWDIFKESLPVTVGSVLLTMIPAVIWVYATMISGISLVAFFEQQEEMAIVIFSIATPISVMLLFLMAFLGPGQAKIFLRAARGEEVTIGMLFSGGRFLLRNLLASTVFFSCVLIGSAACMVPGVLISLMWWAYQFVLIDEDVPAMACLARSKEIMQGRWADVFLLGLVGGAINYVVSSFCCVAGLFSQAYLGLLLAAIYLELTGQMTAGKRTLSRKSVDSDVDEEPSTHDD